MSVVFALATPPAKSAICVFRVSGPGCHKGLKLLTKKKSFEHGKFFLSSIFDKDVLIDRAGLVGEDGATHHGVFDISYLRCIPNMVIFAPLNEIELRNILFTAQLGINYPLAIRYPRGRGEFINWKLPMKAIEIGKGECINEGNEIAILSVGTIGNSIIELQNEGLEIEYKRLEGVTFERAQEMMKYESDIIIDQVNKIFLIDNFLNHCIL